MLTGIVRVHHEIATFVDSTSLFLNAILLYLILNHSRFAMREFKWIFVLTCFGDSLLSAIVLFGQPFVLFEGGYLFLVSNGPFSGRYAVVDHAAMAAFCSALHLNIVFVVMQFVWRYSVICGEKSVIKVSKTTVLFPAAWCIIQVITATSCWMFGQEELRDEGNRILLNNGWQFDNQTAPYPSLVPGASFKTVVHHVFYLSSSIIGYVIIVSCQYGVARYLRQLGEPSHHRTHRANNEVKRALIALALTPLCSLVPTAVMIGSNALQISLGQTISAYMSLGMTIITLFNPIVTMWFVRPYRRALLNMLSGRRGRVSGNSGSSPRAGPPVLAKPPAPHAAQTETAPATLQSATGLCQTLDRTSHPDLPAGPTSQTI